MAPLQSTIVCGRAVPFSTARRHHLGTEWYGRWERRITVSPGLVCYQGAIGESTNQGAHPNATCLLVKGDKSNVSVRKDPLVVEATLTESCIPVFLFIPVIYHGEFRCRNSETPKRDPSAPIWRFYYAEPSHP